MDYLNLALVCILAYVLGSLNFALVFSKGFLGFDIREHGSKNAGSTNVLRTMGKKWAMAVLTCDILKAFIAVLIGGYFLGSEGRIIAGVLAIIGHVYPVFFNFKGGKGVASSAGVMLAFDYRICLVLILIFFITLLITKWVSLSSMLASLYVPVGMFLYYQKPLFLVIGTAIPIAIIYLHRANIKRIINGNENKISFKK